MWPFEISIHQVLGLYHEIAIALAESDEKIGEDWDEADAALARIILSERAYVRAVEDKRRAMVT